MAYRRLSLTLILLLIFMPGVFAMEFPYRVFWETPLVTADQTWVPGSFIVSPDGMRFAYITIDNGRQKVICDGQEHSSYEEISNLCFTPDSGALAYIGKLESTFCLVINGVAGKRHDLIVENSLIFSPDGKHYAFVGKTGDKWLVVTEKGEEKTYDEIGADLLSYSPDSLNLAYPARVGEKWIVVINGRESKAYDGIRALIFSPDSNRIAAVVRMSNFFAVSIDNQEGPAFTMVKPGSLVFGPDSQRFGYVAIDQGQEFVVMNHQAGKAYDRIISEQMAFSSDGKRTAFAAQLQGEQFMVVDGVEGKPYAALTEAPPVFSPDGQKVAYPAFNGKNWAVVFGGVEQVGFASIGKGSLQFSKKGRLVYSAKTLTGKWTVVLDGIAGRYYDAIGANSITISPDGKNVVYSAKQGAKWLVNLDNQEGRLFDGIVRAGTRQIRFNGPVFFSYCAVEGLNIITIQERIASKIDFMDFNGPVLNQPGISKPDDLPIPEFKFEFNPPSGLRFIRTTKIVDVVEAEMMNQQLREEEVQMLTEIHKGPSGFQINYTITKYLVNDVEDPTGGKNLSILEGVKFTANLDEQGFITGFVGLEEFDRKLKTLPAGQYRKYKDQFSEETMEKQLRDSWKFSVEDFIGKSFQLGDVWQSSAKVPLPNGETGTAAADISFTKETVFASIPCVLIRVDFDLNSSNLRNFIGEMIKRGVPQLETEPKVNISGVGESVVDPRTLLGYSSRIEMVMQALVELPNLGEKKFTYKRLVEMDFDYSD